MRRRTALVNRLRYLLERQFIRGTRYQLLVMAFLVLGISVLGGVLAFGTGDEDGLLDTIWWAFLRLTDPGYLGDDEGAWRRVVSTLLTVSGYVVFMGALIAILTQWLGSQMRLLERGLTPVSLSGHIVVLGWTDRTLPLLRELVAAEGRVKRFLQRVGGAGRLRLVVLTEELTPELAEALRNDAVLGPNLDSVILRSGSSLNNEHLNRAACDRAAAIILPARRTSLSSTESSDVETIKTLLALNGQTNEDTRKRPYVVAEIQSPTKVGVARRAYQGPLEVVAGDVSISRLMVQNLRHPGLSAVYNELLSHGVGQNFYILRDLPIGGQTVADVRARLTRSILCGVVSGTDGAFEVTMNPQGDLPVNESDALVVLAPDVDMARTLAPSATLSVPQPVFRSDVSTLGMQSRLRVLLVGWSSKVALLVKEFSTYKDSQFEIDVLSSRSAEERQQWLQAEIPDSVLTIRHLVGEVTSARQWRKLDLNQYDSVLFLSSDRWQSEEEADARTLVGFLQWQGVSSELAERPLCLLELADAENETLLTGLEGETLISPMLTSHFMVQVALRREMRPIFDALFSAGGPEITLPTLAELGLESGQYRWSSLVDRLAKLGATGLGVKIDSIKGEQLLLNPELSASFELSSTDRVVVLLQTNL